MRILAILLVLAGPVWAEDWRVLNQAGAELALTDRVLVYEGGETQDFRASGRTLYNAGAPSWGYWEIREGRYCSQWPPSRDWDCYDLALSGDGASVRFVDDWENASVGRYTD